MKRVLGLLAALLTLLAAPAFAQPLSYYNQPFDTPNSAVNALIQTLNGTAPYSGVVACTGTTTSTCQGNAISVSITGLTTADGGTLSAAMTVTDAVVTAASIIHCQVNGYAGTGVPTDVLIVPGAGSFSFKIQNTSASAALNATVVSNCLVF